MTENERRARATHAAAIRFARTVAQYAKDTERRETAEARAVELEATSAATYDEPAGPPEPDDPDTYAAWIARAQAEDERRAFPDREPTDPAECCGAPLDGPCRSWCVNYDPAAIAPFADLTDTDR
jgi:hypothetical protein